MHAEIILLLLVIVAGVFPKPLDDSENIQYMRPYNKVHNVERRFINPSLTSGGFDDIGVTKMRTKRSEEDCERLALCRLHARSGRNFFATYSLYFVNKENARLWDHHVHSLADCSRRFHC
ncbi:uncharacterized protein LOC131844957 [Achroia grisella]|uniref:uncharacterized protein LOC131844957 n=1 Tax=Achroia grisella TaxID=688607 RepID=UPI0027D206E3|nr:uncharacterized protein LOC131844957 [Achroia grisella]